MSETPPTKSASYQSRAKADCIMLGDIEGQTCWGIVRVSKLQCYLCEGHRVPPDYREEPTALTEDELAKRRLEIEEQVKAEDLAKAAAIEEWGVPMDDEDWLRGGWTAARWSQYQANRWFRPFMPSIGDVGVGMFWRGTTDVMLTFLHSVIGDGLRVSAEARPTAVDDRLLGMGRQATAELVRRKVPFPDDCYALRLAEPWDGVHDHRNPKYTDPFGERLLVMQFHHLSDKELQLLWGCAYIVADFSGLERGTRQVVMHVFHETGGELKNRDLKETSLDKLDW
jgi:hypothetical protein